MSSPAAQDDGNGFDAVGLVCSGACVVSAVAAGLSGLLLIWGGPEEAGTRSRVFFSAVLLAVVLRFAASAARSAATIARRNREGRPVDPGPEAEPDA